MMNHRGLIRKGLLLLMAVTVTMMAGCGGGGGGGVTDPSVPTQTTVSAIRGFWNPSLGTADGVSTIVLANGDAWVVFLESNIATSFARLQTTTTSSTFSGAGTRYLLSTGTTEAATTTGTYSLASPQTLKGSVISASITNPLDLAYVAGSAVAISDAVGSWTGSYSGGASTLTMNVSSAGALTGSSTTGCTYTGTLQPRTADLAVFDLNYTENCFGSSITMAGIATVNAAKTSIFFAATTADKAKGALFAGSK